MKHDERNASAFVIVGCVMLFFILYQAVSILACRYLDQREARYQMNHSYQMSIEDEEGSADHYGRIYDQFMKQAVEKLHGTFTVVGFLMPNDSMTDPVETDIVVGEKTGTGACMIGAGLQEKLKAFGEKTDSIQLGTQEFPVESIHSNRSAFAIDNKAYLYWDEMTQQQREYIYEEILSSEQVWNRKM